MMGGSYRKENGMKRQLVNGLFSGKIYFLTFEKGSALRVDLS